MKLYSSVFLVNIFFAFLGSSHANSEMAKEINYISNDGRETKSEVVCVNNQSAFIYENNVSQDIRLEQLGESEELGMVTIDEAIEKICR